MWECDVNREFSQNEDMKHYFDHYHIVDPLKLRHADGGQTNEARLYHRSQEDKQIRALTLQACTLMLTDRRPYLPEIITENFDEDVSNYFSLIKCTVLPPRGLFHPVLPYRTQDQMHEVWHFPQKTDTLFKEYIGTFTKIKLEATVSQELHHGRTKAMVRQ